MKATTALFALLVLGIAGCKKAEPPTGPFNHITMESYGTLEDGREVSLFTITNKNGMIARVTNFGAILVGLEVPDKDGNLADVTHGYDTLDAWIADTAYFGATVGRYGNRIAHGKFSLNGEEYTLATNNDPGGIPCHLHGGEVGFNKVLWEATKVARPDANGVKLTYVSQDGEEGYPGELTTVVTYWLNDRNELIWEAKATVNGKATPVNIIHHSYWNLSGDPMSSINDHELTVDAEYFLPTDKGLIPSGYFAPVADSPFDFNTATAIGARINEPHVGLVLAGGYDHCWVLDDSTKVRFAASLHDPKSGRTMEVHTDQPGIQFYGGNFLDGTVAGKGGAKYPHRSACCLETQRFPDSPNQEDFPESTDPVLKPGETYSHTMIHRFSW
jgi:aldose 1-epimerase